MPSSKRHPNKIRTLIGRASTAHANAENLDFLITRQQLSSLSGVRKPRDFGSLALCEINSLERGCKHVAVTRTMRGKSNEGGHHPDPAHWPVWRAGREHLSTDPRRPIARATGARRVKRRSVLAAVGEPGHVWWPRGCCHHQAQEVRHAPIFRAQASSSSSV